MYAPDSIDLLKNSGIDFKRNEEDGIDVEYFGELLVTSGLVLFDNVKWVSFHSCVTCWARLNGRGYDFGYLLKILTCEPLPTDESTFFKLLRIWFPCIYDIKYIVRSVKTLRGGLQEIAESLGVQRIGPQHQAGSDSLLTAAVFFRIRATYFSNSLDDDYYKWVAGWVALTAETTSTDSRQADTARCRRRRCSAWISRTRGETGGAEDSMML